MIALINIYTFIFSDPKAIKHGSAQVFLTFLQQIQSESDMRLRKIKAGLEKPLPRNSVYVSVDRNLANVLEEYDVRLFF